MSTTTLIPRGLRDQVIDSGVLPEDARQHFVIDRDNQTVTEYYEGCPNIVVKGDFVYDPTSPVVRDGVRNTFNDIADSIEALAPEVGLVAFTDEGGKLTLKLDIPPAVPPTFSNLEGVHNSGSLEFQPPCGYLSFAKRWSNPELWGWDRATGGFKCYTPEDNPESSCIGFGQVTSEDDTLSLQSAHRTFSNYIHSIARGPGKTSSGYAHKTDPVYWTLITDLHLSGLMTTDLMDALRSSYEEGKLGAVVPTLFSAIPDDSKPRYQEFVDNWIHSS